MVDIKLDGDRSVWIVRIQGELTATSVDEFRKGVAVLMAKAGNTHRYVIDLESVGFIDSTGLGSLISLVKRVRDMRGDVKLACLQPAPRQLFEVIHAHKHLETFDALEDAVDSF